METRSPLVLGNLVDVAEGPAAQLAEKARLDRVAALDAKLATNSLGAHWQHRDRGPAAAACLWRWHDIRAGLMEAAEVVRLGADTGRRTVQLRNPALAAGTSRTIQMSVQLVMPGETARAHRHTAQALRFVVEGHGTFTTVEGERFFMEPNDLVLTPGWTWHDHTNSTDEPSIWLDGLDVPLATLLEAQFQVDFPEPMQPITKDDGHSAETVRAGGTGNGFEFPPYRYAWSETMTELARITESRTPADDDPYDGVLLEYANPVTGGHTLPTMACCVQLLRPGQSTASHRHTGTTIYHAIAGAGTCVIDGEPYPWGPRDCFTVPPWHSHHFVNASASEPTILFSMSDLPILKALRLYREEPTEA